jgi:endonuclease-3
MISIRTLDEVTLTASKRLFAQARTPAEMVALSEAAIQTLIRPSTFYERKAGQILTISRKLLDDHAGELPCDVDLMLTFPGIGPKCANLAYGIACGGQVISVDIHVHRVTNRWGYVTATRPEATMLALQEVLPRSQWININRLLVPFGKHICTGRLPRCSTCPVLAYCRQVGVTAHR